MNRLRLKKNTLIFLNTRYAHPSYALSFWNGLCAQFGVLLYHNKHAKYSNNTGYIKKIEVSMMLPEQLDNCVQELHNERLETEAYQIKYEAHSQLSFIAVDRSIQFSFKYFKENRIELSTLLSIKNDFSNIYII